jgi:hypothetical protein
MMGRRLLRLRPGPPRAGPLRWVQQSINSRGAAGGGGAARRWRPRRGVVAMMSASAIRFASAPRARGRRRWGGHGRSIGGTIIIIIINPHLWGSMQKWPRSVGQAFERPTSVGLRRQPPAAA